jgi:predicted P-loop ATPase
MTIAQPRRSDNFPAEITALRLQLRKNGFEPLPFFGKNSVMKGWPRTDQDIRRLGWLNDADEIQRWAEIENERERGPHAINTGLDATFTPAINFRVSIEAAAEASETLAREFFEEHGNIYVRFGWPPQSSAAEGRRLILLRTDEPFAKLSRTFIAPDDSKQIVEILSAGEHYVVDGDVTGMTTNPRTLYRWPGADLAGIKRENLPYCRREDAERYLDALTKLYIEQFGFVQNTATIELEWLRRQLAKTRAKIAAYKAANPEPTPRTLEEIRKVIVELKEHNKERNISVDDIIAVLDRHYSDLIVDWRDRLRHHVEKLKTKPPIEAVFRDRDKSGNPKPSLANAVIAIHALGIKVRYDCFHNRIHVTYNGESKTIHEGLLTDNTISAIRSLINNTYQVDCGDPNTLAAIREIAWNNAYDPVLDMLNECQSKWDGTKRIDTWVINYLGCKDTPLNRAIGRIVLIAACRRARRPGCKFDNITVQEGPEGTNKSTAIRILAGDENFSDQSILGANDKEVQEQLDGIWMHENADLAGMVKAEVERVKAFASRQVDRARPAFGRVREDRHRRSIEWGTTNDKEYLLSQTGNRRFWPLETSNIDIEALKRDREQLLGEAATYEATGETITLNKKLWPDARNAQEQRRVADPWEDILANIPDSVDMFVDGTKKIVTIIHTSDDGQERVASTDLLTYVLDIPKAQQTPAHGRRLANAMERLGWTRNSSGQVRISGISVRGYIRPARENDDLDEDV